MKTFEGLPKKRYQLNLPPLARTQQFRKEYIIAEQTWTFFELNFLTCALPVVLMAEAIYCV
ncbi:MAG: hypothetical protein EON51_01700 [Acinetobacter sp.]|nr:MAG: hypothetical protein EON51_01700 [Acinetobacter sp.]